MIAAISVSLRDRRNDDARGGMDPAPFGIIVLAILRPQGEESE